MFNLIFIDQVWLITMLEDLQIMKWEAYQIITN